MHQINRDISSHCFSPAEELGRRFAALVQLNSPAGEKERWNNGLV